MDVERKRPRRRWKLTKNCVYWIGPIAKKATHVGFGASRIFITDIYNVSASVNNGNYWNILDGSFSFFFVLCVRFSSVRSLQYSLNELIFSLYVFIKSASQEIFGWTMNGHIKAIGWKCVYKYINIINDRSR